MRAPPPTSRRRVPGQGLTGRLGGSKRAMFGVAVLGSLALVGLFADLLASDRAIAQRAANGIELFQPPSEEGGWKVRALVPFGPAEPSGASLEPPSRVHPLGTDAEGRDVFARLVHGARVALFTGLVVAFAGVLGGATAGALASQYSRRIGQGLERVAQAVDAFPALIVVALVRAIEGRSSTLSVVVGATIVQWASVARLVRTEIHRLSTEDFVLAARALGSSRTRILLRHLLPHLGPPMVSSAALGLGAVVMLEATLSFMGLGPPILGASWGEMLAEGARHPDHGALFVLPTLLLSITIGAAYLVGEGVREASDPVTYRLRGRDL